MSALHHPSGQNPPPMLFARQRKLLALLDALGGQADNGDFQKLLFLYCQEREADLDAPYEFVPHRFGAFSFTSNADRRKLVERGLLTDDEPRWVLTAEGQRTVANRPDATVRSFADRHQRLRGDALVAETYRRFPYYATRSEIAADVLAGDPAALGEVAAARAATTNTRLSTIGYEGRSLESYLNELLRAGVSLLCDVRRNPISRKYGFSKGALTKGCEGVGIAYEHLPDLGIASEQRRSLETQEDYDILFEEYERVSLPEQGEALAKILGWIGSGQHVALTCYERSPEQCHRHCVAEAIQSELGKGRITNL